MAHIRAFHGIHPDFRSGFFNKEPYQQITPVSKLEALRLQLEPALGTAPDEVELQGYLDFFNQLLAEEALIVDAQAAIYVYELDTEAGKQQGIWVLTDLRDMVEGKILTHEQTLEENEDEIRAYRNFVGLEGMPVLLTYPPAEEINRLLEQAMQPVPERIFQEGEKYHKLWKVTDKELIQALEVAFKKIEYVYVADGHHRMAVAANMQEENGLPYTSTLYMASDQLRVEAFNRLVVGTQKEQTAGLPEFVRKTFFVEEISGNRPYIPDRLHRFGMYCNYTWYRLDLKADLCLQSPDALILQEFVLRPFFNIEEPRTDKRLLSFEASNLDALVKTAIVDANPVIFTLFPITTGQLMEQAALKSILPPKSSWIEPKLPYGLLMYQSKYSQ